MRFPRMTTRRWQIAVALVAVLLALYITLVELPARRRRFRRSDQLVKVQIDLFRRAATSEETREHEETEAARAASRQPRLRRQPGRGGLLLKRQKATTAFPYAGKKRQHSTWMLQTWREHLLGSIARRPTTWR